MPTQNLSLVILFVTDVDASVRFYSDLLEAKPVEQSPNFAAFALPTGLMLGLWAVKDARPAATAPPGGTELTFTDADVDGVYRAWQAKGVRIAAKPADLDFGRTFLALDPDGHRLRVFRPAA